MSCDPSIGRFISEDPVRDGLNWYVYCGNNPIMFVDPLGLADVLARNYLEERGAIVNYIGNGSASVIYNGKYYSISGKINNDGRLVMDDNDIDNIIGWSSTVYYFYGNEQANHAKNNINDLRNNSYAVIAFPTTNRNNFTTNYNAMPSSVDVVIINQHGSPTYIDYFSLSKLDMTKDIGTFVLLSCNAAHQWTAEESIASKIANTSGGRINQLISADGTHFRGTFYNPNQRKISVSGDDKWKKLISPALLKTAKSQGFIRYQWNGTAYIKNSIGKTFSSVRSLLRKVGS